MTKKNYIAIAEIVKKHFKGAVGYNGNDEVIKATIRQLISDLAYNVLMPDNPRFNEERFFVACGFIGKNEITPDIDWTK
jgi:hypothetical protein